MVEMLREKIVLPLGIIGIVIYFLFRMSELSAYEDWDIIPYILLVFVGGVYLNEYSMEEGIANIMIMASVGIGMYFVAIMTGMIDVFMGQEGENTGLILEYDVLVLGIFITLLGVYLEIEERRE